MNKVTATFCPDWIVIPGEILEEVLQERRMKKVTLAKHCGVTAKHISQIISGVATITPRMALKFEEVLGGHSAEMWLKLEAGYRLKLLRRKK